MQLYFYLDNRVYIYGWQEGSDRIALEEIDIEITPCHASLIRTGQIKIISLEEYLSCLEKDVRSQLIKIEHEFFRIDQVSESLCSLIKVRVFCDRGKISSIKETNQMMTLTREEYSSVLF